MKDRTNQILSMLAADRKIEVAVLAQHLGVSQVTVRKDLDGLERQGIIKREHGFAALASTNNINGRLAYHYEEKRKIAARAAKLVPDGTTIMIESGSCCALLAAELAAQKRDVTIVTNSAFIADYIRKSEHIQTVLLGGTYQPDAQVMVGPMVRQCAENFWVEMFFIGVDGYSDRAGFTNQDQMRAQAVRDMAQQAERVMILTESEKFTRRGTVPLNLKDQISAVITDDHITVEMTGKLQEQGVTVYTVG